MRRRTLHALCGQYVELTPIRGVVRRGILRKTGDTVFLDTPHLFLPRDYYLLTNTQHRVVLHLLRASHIKQCVVCEHSDKTVA